MRHRVHLDRPADGGPVRRPVQSGRRATTSCPRPARRRAGMPLFTWKPLNGPPELLRARREGREVQQHRRLRLHAAAGLRAAQHPDADDVPGRGDVVLLGGAAGDGHRRRQRARRPPAREPAELPQGVGAAVARDAGRRLDDHRAADLPVDAGQRRARNYRVQVAQDPSFGTPLEDITTAATTFTPTGTYPADTVLYWRVRANDENLVGLPWSATGTFRRTLPAPVPSPTNPTHAATSSRPGRGAPVTGRRLLRRLGRPARRDAQGPDRLPHARS